MTEGCFTPLSTLFQPYYGDSSHITVFPRCHQYWAEAVNCMPKDTQTTHHPSYPVKFTPASLPLPQVTSSIFYH